MKNTRFKQFIQICIYVLAGSAGSLISMHPAFADNCTNLEQNEAWYSNFTSLNEAYKQEDWKTALNHAKILEDICDQSPALNYTIAHIYKSQSDNEKYLFYLQKATQNTEKFSVDKDLLNKMWEEKYEAAHPEAIPEIIEARHNTIIALTDENEALKTELESLKQTAANSSQAMDDALLWTSVGIVGTGLILTGVGAYYVATNKDKSVGADGKGYYTKREYTIGWGLIGAGIGVTAIGTAAMGIFGYRYRKNHNQDNSQAVSFTLLPNYTSLGFAF